MALGSRESLDLTSDEDVLISRIVEKGIRNLKPSVGPEGVTYPNIQGVVKDEELDWSSVRKLLESLDGKGLLRVKEKDWALFCPECDSTHVYSKYLCPKCQSKDISRLKLIEHQFCGYTGVISIFIKGSKLICPSCETELGLINERPKGDGSRSDYQIIGSSFECVKCGNRFDRPNIEHRCQNCDADFTYKNSTYEPIYEYEVLDSAFTIFRVREDIAVLLVDDNPDDAEIIIRHLRSSGKPFEIEHVLDGNLALDNLMVKHYDVILLDYHLPGLNGIQVLEKIRDDDISTPVIMFTGADDRKTAVTAMKLGASDYLIKSLEVYKDLPDIIERQISD